MAKLMISLMMIFSSLFIAMPIGGFATKLNEKSLLLHSICSANKRVAKIPIYVQDILGGPNATVYEVARASITSDSPSLFGRVLVVDDLVTAGPDISSKKLGRSQGIITFSDLETLAATMNFNIIFTAGKYNGSSVSVVGRNQITNQEREFSVVGGTGVFRFACGYVTSSTYSSVIDADQTSYTVLKQTIYAILPLTAN